MFSYINTATEIEHPTTYSMVNMATFMLCVCVCVCVPFPGGVGGAAGGEEQEEEGHLHRALRPQVPRAVVSGECTHGSDAPIKATEAHLI